MIHPIDNIRERAAIAHVMGAAIREGFWDPEIIAQEITTCIARLEYAEEHPHTIHQCVAFLKVHCPTKPWTDIAI